MIFLAAHACPAKVCRILCLRSIVPSTRYEMISAAARGNRLSSRHRANRPLCRRASLRVSIRSNLGSSPPTRRQSRHGRSANATLRRALELTFRISVPSAVVNLRVAVCLTSSTVNAEPSIPGAFHHKSFVSSTSTTFYLTRLYSVISREALPAPVLYRGNRSRNHDSRFFVPLRRRLRNATIPLSPRRLEYRGTLPLSSVSNI